MTCDGVATWCETHQRCHRVREQQICDGVDVSPHDREQWLSLWENREPSDVSVSHPVNTTPMPPIVFDPVPRDQWPIAIKIIASFAAEGERGVGDTIKRMLGTPGLIYQAVIKQATGSECTGCGFRQTKWNQLYPYDGTPIEVPESFVMPAARLIRPPVIHDNSTDAKQRRIEAIA